MQPLAKRYKMCRLSVFESLRIDLLSLCFSFLDGFREWRLVILCSRTLHEKKFESSVLRNIKLRIKHSYGLYPVRDVLPNIRWLTLEEAFGYALSCCTESVCEESMDEFRLQLKKCINVEKLNCRVFDNVGARLFTDDVCFFEKLKYLNMKTFGILPHTLLSFCILPSLQTLKIEQQNFYHFLYEMVRQNSNHVFGLEFLILTSKYLSTRYVKYDEECKVPKSWFPKLSHLTIDITDGKGMLHLALNDLLPQLTSIKLNCDHSIDDGDNMLHKLISKFKNVKKLNLRIPARLKSNQMRTLHLLFSQCEHVTEMILECLLPPKDEGTPKLLELISHHPTLRILETSYGFPHPENFTKYVDGLYDNWRFVRLS